MANDDDIAAGSITRAAFDAALSRYDALISSVSKPVKVDGGETLTQLDAWRLNELPEVVHARAKDGGEVGKKAGWLEKAEVERLVAWKLKHGTFRPSLAKLVASNPPPTVITTTQSAYDQYSSMPHKHLTRALKTLATLKGIGPATASLLLSVLSPDRVPFFSDELYKWVVPGGKRPSKYDAGEYMALFQGVAELRERLEEVPAVDVERVAYVLEKEAGQVGAGAVAKRKAEAVDEKEVVPKTKKPKSERKKGKGAGAGEVLRRSARNVGGTAT
ncbi:MAG: hypothetical protein M1832_001597 [Thelocarpon impressellum]|nr:MAG: hypothetical protein M1832_001597 [Thelocarpon impressellum]